MNGRVEDSLIGRFMSADPKIQDPSNPQNYNRYSYVNNNPVTGMDPTGFDCTDTDSCDLDGGGGGGVSSGASAPGSGLWVPFSPTTCSGNCADGVYYDNIGGELSGPPTASDGGADATTDGSANAGNPSASTDPDNSPDAAPAQQQSQPQTDTCSDPYVCQVNGTQLSIADPVLFPDPAVPTGVSVVGQQPYSAGVDLWTYQLTNAYGEPVTGSNYSWAEYVTPAPGAMPSSNANGVYFSANNGVLEDEVGVPGPVGDNYSGTTSTYFQSISVFYNGTVYYLLGTMLQHTISVGTTGNVSTNVFPVLP